MPPPTRYRFCRKLMPPKRSMSRSKLVLARRFLASEKLMLMPAFSVNASFDTGDQIFFDWDNPYLGRETGSNVSVSVRPVSSLQSQISLNTSRFTDPTNGNAEIFDVQIIRAQTTYQISNPLLIRNITEYDTFDRQFDFNLLVTYRVNGGTVFYVGYDDHYRQEDQIDHLDEQFFMSNNFRRTNRAVFTKLQYLFRY